jgi:hypothetical protein
MTTIPDPTAQRVARRHLAGASRGDRPRLWTEFGRVSAVDVQKLLEPHVGPVTDVRIVATPTSIAWTAIGGDGSVVWGQVLPRAIVVSDTDVILGADITVGLPANADLRIDLVDLAVG